jgi:hypothetical protein
MAFRLTEQEKKSLIVTSLLFVVLFLLMFYFKFSQNNDLVDLEGGGGGGGVTVNFGDSEVGSGSDYKSEVLKVSERVKQTPAAAVPEDEVLASDLDDAPTVVKTKPVVKKDPSKEESKPSTVVKAPQPSKSTSDALDNLLNGNNKGGDGDDGQAGNKGKSNGDKNSGSYYGDGGSGGGTGGGTGSGNGTGTGPGSGSGSGGGSGAGRGTGVGNYQLAGRKVLAKPQPQYKCNEQGIVVVQITVDQNGRVTAAQPGARGTTNSAKCLQDQAKIAAMNTKFDSSEAAPEKQVGKIVYNFKLTE